MIHAPTRDAGTDPVRIFTARLSDEVLRYATLRHELLQNKVSTIRTPRGVVRVGDELYMATKPKESAAGIMDRLGFSQRALLTFPEEMLRFEGAEEEVERPVAEVEVPGLPVAWTELGLEIPSLPPDVDGRVLALAGTGQSFPDWERIVKRKRRELKLPGDPDRPFQWSNQDFFIMASLTYCNIVFVRGGPGGLNITKWIAPPAGPTVKNPIYILFWGPQELLVTSGKNYRFQAKNLPGDFLTALDGAHPLDEAEAKGLPVESVVPLEEEELTPPAAEQVAPAPVQVAPAPVQVAPVIVPPAPVQVAPAAEQQVAPAALSPAPVQVAPAIVPPAPEQVAPAPEQQVPEQNQEPIPALIVEEGGESPQFEYAQVVAGGESPEFEFAQPAAK